MESAIQQAAEPQIEAAKRSYDSQIAKGATPKDADIEPLVEAAAFVRSIEIAFFLFAFAIWEASTIPLSESASPLTEREKESGRRLSDALKMLRASGNEPTGLPVGLDDIIKLRHRLTHDGRRLTNRSQFDLRALLERGRLRTVAGNEIAFDKTLVTDAIESLGLSHMHWAKQVDSSAYPSPPTLSP